MTYRLCKHEHKASFDKGCVIKAVVRYEASEQIIVQYSKIPALKVNSGYQKLEKCANKNNFCEATLLQLIGYRGPCVIYGRQFQAKIFPPAEKRC